MSELAGAQTTRLWRHRQLASADVDRFVLLLTGQVSPDGAAHRAGQVLSVVLCWPPASAVILQ